jgi:hypothetical protein
MTGDDMIFCQEKGKFMSGGFSLNSILLKKGMAPMRTQNGGPAGTDDLKGGGGADDFASIFRHLAVPAGLFYQEGGAVHHFDSDQDAPVLSEDLHQQLLSKVEASETNRRRATSKRAPRTVPTKNKTQKNL